MFRVIVRGMRVSSVVLILRRRRRRHRQVQVEEEGEEAVRERLWLVSEGWRGGCSLRAEQTGLKRGLLSIMICFIITKSGLRLATFSE